MVLEPSESVWLKNGLSYRTVRVPVGIFKTFRNFEDLVIHNVTFGDAAVYRCQIRVRQSDTTTITSTGINVTVKGNSIVFLIKIIPKIHDIPICNYG